MLIYMTSGANTMSKKINPDKQQKGAKRATKNAKRLAKKAKA